MSALSSAILVFNPGRQGGIVKYAWHQAEELARLGNSVSVLYDKGAGQHAPHSVILREELVP